jgi:hypothetical protein
LLRIFAIAAAMASVALAECPGGCSGNGVCGPRDMCTCFKNFMGNDCALRVCPFGYAHVDTPKGDINMDRSVNTAGTILANSQMYPGGTYEWTNPAAAAQEAHFYMECSNEGICDRATGLCVCYPGYEGSACQRAKCPNACNNRGVCKSMAQVAANGDRELSITGNPRGNVKTAYTLWDADKGYQCVCDPGFEGPDCSKRSCKVGVDPLYEAAGYPIYETFNIVAMATLDAEADTIDSTKSWIQLRVYDHEGESYLTPRIAVSSDAANVGGTTFTKAFQALPNKVFSSITCSSRFVDAATDVTKEDGFYVTCQYTDNPGPHRLPQVAASAFVSGAVAALTASRAYVTADIRRGESVDLCATALSPVYASGAGSTTITVTGSTVGITVPSLIKIKDQLLIALTLASATTLTTAWALPTATATAIAAGATMYYASGVTVTVDVCTIEVWNVGSNSFACKVPAATPTAVVGSRIMYQNAIYFVRSVTLAPAVITVDRNFGGKSTDGASVSGATDNFYVLTTATPATGTYTYVSQCSGRGLCDFGSGICQCFKGYTNDNCDTQNILAF